MAGTEGHNAAQSLMGTYRRLPVAFARGEGVWLWDEQGKRYLDALSGIAVCGLGHAHPRVTEALCAQAAQLVHTSNLYRITAQEALGRRLCALSGQDKVFFCNSGAEANEAAIKLARLHGHAQGVDAPAIVVMENAFHGRTLATLTATGNRKVQAGFEPLVAGFVRAPFDDLEALRAIAENSRDVVAVLVEPVQGEAGIVIPEAGYLRGVRELCERHGWLLMLDEIQSGMGRSGRWLAHQHAGVEADVVTLAKGLGNGVPIGACLARGAAAELMQPGHHGSTFGGNPLACSAALAVLDALEADALIENAAARGRQLHDGLHARLAALEGVREIRSLGLLVGVVLERDCAVLVERALERGLLINVTGGSVVRLLPPLIVTEAEVQTIVETVGELIAGFLGEDAA